MAKTPPGRKQGTKQLPDFSVPDFSVPDFSVEDSHAYYIYSLQSLSYAALAEALRPHDLTPPAWRVLANDARDPSRTWVRAS